MKVFVTGINGFLGAQLAQRFAQQGHEVAGSARDPGRLAAPLQGLDVTAWQLGDAPPAAALRGLDTIVHAAYSPLAQDHERNVHGTLAIARAAADAGTTRQLLLSSFSAVPGATSAYGRMKHELESRFDVPGAAIVRPGLVVGPGGLFAQMVRNVRRMPVLPLPDGGRRPVPIIGHLDLLDCLLRLATEPSPPRACNLCYAERPPLRTLLRAIAKALGRRRAMPTIPVALLVPPVALLHRFGLRFGVSPESLKAYRTNTEGQHQSDHAAFGLPERGLQEVVSLAVDALAHAADGA